MDKQVFPIAENVPENGTLEAYDPDRVALARSGKRQVLTRNFGLTSMVGLCCSLMTTWEGVLVSFLLGFQNGGPAGLLYGFIYVWLGTLSVFITLGELSSMAPTAGGQYHWVNLLAPAGWKRFLSYVTGWLTVAGWTAATATAMFFVAGLIQGVVVLNYPNYSPTGWQGTLMYWLVLLLCVCINTVFSKALPAIEIVVLILHVMGFFAILIPLVYLSPQRNSAHDIFTTFINGGNWKTQALSFFIGLNGNAASFIGTDGAVHMSEEIKNASRNVPRSMIWSIFINGVLGFGILVAFLLCADITTATQSTAAYPFVPVLAEAVGSNAGGTAMVSLVVALTIFAGVGTLAAASRMMWSFARDHGLPGWRTLSKVHNRTTIPLAAIGVVATIVALLGLINIGNATAFGDVVSLLLEALYTSYFLACALLLYRRVRGEIRIPVDGAGPINILALEDSNNKDVVIYEWGPWRVPGLLGIMINIFACVYLLILGFFSFWPTAVNPTPQSMNYSVLVTGAVSIFSVFYYLISAKRTYKGPIIEVIEELEEMRSHRVK